jgi:hypothetical protein
MFDEFVGADEVPLLAADGIERNGTVGAHDEQRWLLAERRETLRDVVRIEDLAIIVWKEFERIVVRLQELLRVIDGVRCDGNEGGTGGRDLVERLTQLREMLAAERSNVATQENQHDGCLARVLRELPRCAANGGQREVGCRCSGCCGATMS